MEILYENRTDLLSFRVEAELSPVIHLHKEFEIVHVIEGSAVAYADRNCCVIQKGDTFIAFPNQIHYYKNDIPGTFIVMIFSAELLYSLNSRVMESIPDKNVIPREMDETLCDIFQRMLHRDGVYEKLILYGYTNVMMGLILSHLQLKAAGSENNTALHNIINYCTQNYRENITLDLVAEQLHLSKYYISHLLNQKLNQNFREYVNHQRIAQACLLLRETDSKIVDIAANVGFGTLRSFNRSFKIVMGISPAKYREENVKLLFQSALRNENFSQ